MSAQGHHLYDCDGRPPPHAPPSAYPSPREPGAVGESEASIDLGAYVIDSSEEFLTDLFTKHGGLKADGPPYHYPYPPAPAYGYPQLYGPERKALVGLGGGGGRPAYEAGLSAASSAAAVKEEPRDQGREVGRPQQQQQRGGGDPVTYDPLQYQVAHCGQTSMHLAPGLMSAMPQGRMYKGPPSVPTAVTPCGPVLRDRALASGKSKKSVNKDSMEYRLRRERNNIAVRKSRDKAKRRNMETQQKAMQFMTENERLRDKVEQLSQELDTLRGLFRQLPDGGVAHQRP